MSDSLRPHESQHARPPCPSPTPGVHWDPHPSSQWCHPAISSSVVSFSSCPQYLPASESFPVSQLFAWSGQSTGVSALASFLPKNTQDWSPLDDSNILCCWLSGLPSLRKCLVDFLTGCAPWYRYPIQPNKGQFADCQFWAITNKSAINICIKVFV